MVERGAPNQPDIGQMKAYSPLKQNETAPVEAIDAAVSLKVAVEEA